MASEMECEYGTRTPRQQRRAWGSSGSPFQSPAGSGASPGPRTPTKPAWQQRCEAARVRCPYPISYTLNQASEKGQDRIAIDTRNGDAIWAVFDGHFTAQVSGHASQVFPGLVWNQPTWPDRPDEALRCALEQCNESARAEEKSGGSTAVIVAATRDALWCCCAGDSRAVAGLRNGGVQRMSVDHTCDVPEEVARIKARGGRLSFGRLQGLPMTRGLGNFHLEDQGFQCIPQVNGVALWEVAFVVVASDGLWDVFKSDKECIDLVREWGTAGMADCAEHLAAHARSLGSVDDIAVIVAYFPHELAAGPAGA
eukprot:gb/GFBE01041355.1/.p1 GENE.gb/GFBE01041355.1/~~gb/GFBE01041355.1/.p1  ORF type:complete len:311 (+),score=27.00 gb/GFBE01041355.1/:1-933(+)